MVEGAHCLCAPFLFLTTYSQSVVLTNCPALDKVAAPLPCSVTTQDPVVLPDSRVTIDRPTIERHLLSSQTDPFRWAAPVLNSS